jgi:hypothetical protein
MKITRPTAVRERIQGLDLDVKHIRGNDSKDPRWKYNIYIPAVLKDANLSITIQGEVVQTGQVSSNGTRSFILRVKLSSETSNVQIQSIDAQGRVMTEVVQFVFREKTEKSVGPVKPLRHVISPSLGVSSIQYNEALVNPYSALTVTFKGAYSYRFSSKFDIGASFYMTAFSLWTSMSGADARFFGANGRIGYVPIAVNNWKVSIQAGLYYTTMFVASRAFGFQNLMGPQLYPSISRQIGDYSIAGYFKFCPVGAGFNLATFTDREMAGGVQFRFPVRNQKVYSIGLDIADLRVKIDGTQVSTTSVSLSASYGWIW